METETIKIASADHESGFILINKSDFDTAMHKLFSEKPVKSRRASEDKE